MKSWTSAFSVSSPIAALDERWMQPGWCGAAPGPRGFPFPSRPAPPRLASPRAARAAAASHCWRLLPGPRDPSPAPRPGEGAGAERSRLGGSGPAQPATSSWLGPSPRPRKGSGWGWCPNQADPGLLRWAKRLSGMRTRIPPTEGLEGFWGHVVRHSELDA